MTRADRRIAFLSSSFEYTTGIFPFVERLQARGYTVYWIAFRGHEMRWLRQMGVPAERVLDTWSGIRPGLYSADELRERLGRVDSGRPPYVNDIVLMDRMLRRKPYGFALTYLAHIEAVLTGFLVENGIRLVSAGRDSALQISCAKICERLGIPSVVPTVTRIPEDRYGFCVGHTEAQFVHFRPPDGRDRQLARACLDEFRATKPVPTTLVFERKNNQFLRRLPKDLGIVVKTVRRGLDDSENDFTRYSLKRLFAMYSRRRLNAAHVRIAPVYETVGARPFVLYAYQMQPESSIDVLANFFSDQKALITQLARSIPSSHDLYVKAHPDHVGGLSRRALMELKRIPGVRLIDPFIKSQDLIGRASLICTPTGTMAYEAGLLGIPALIFANEFFAALPGVHVVQSVTELPHLIGRLIARGPRRDDAAIEEFLAGLFADTFAGRVTDYFGPFTDDEFAVMLDAYDCLLDTLYSRPPYHRAPAAVPVPADVEAR